jgi:hypothetical protein
MKHDLARLKGTVKAVEELAAARQQELEDRLAEATAAQDGKKTPRDVAGRGGGEGTALARRVHELLMSA